MRDRVFNVLFLCTGSSACSILAEAMLNTMVRGRFRAYSAGNHPKGETNPIALERLRKNRLRTDGLRSQTWEEFAAPGAPPVDFVFTVRDQASIFIGPPIDDLDRMTLKTRSQEIDKLVEREGAA